MICVRCGGDVDPEVMRPCRVFQGFIQKVYKKHKYRKEVSVMAKGKNVKKEVKKAPKAKAVKMPMGKGKKAC